MAVSKIVSIIAKKRAADIAKKKVAKIPAGQARAVAKEQMRGSIRNTNRKISKRTGLTPEEKKEVSIKRSIKKIEFTRPRNPEDVRRGRSVAEQEMRRRLSNPPKTKLTKPTKKEIFLTRGKNIAKRSEVEEVMQRRFERQTRKERAEKIFKAMTPEQKRTMMARAQVKRAMREETAGKTKYGMDVKPRQQLDEKVIERAKELTFQERNQIARKQAIEFGQRREADRRIEEALKEIARREKIQKMTPEQKNKIERNFRKLPKRK